MKILNFKTLCILYVAFTYSQLTFAKKVTPPADMPNQYYDIYAFCNLENNQGTKLLETKSPLMVRAEFVMGHNGHNVDLKVIFAEPLAQFQNEIPNLVKLQIQITEQKKLIIKVTDILANKEMDFSGALNLMPTVHSQGLQFEPEFENPHLKGYSINCARN